MPNKSKEAEEKIVELNFVLPDQIEGSEDQDDIMARFGGSHQTYMDEVDKVMDLFTTEYPIYRDEMAKVYGPGGKIQHRHRKLEELEHRLKETTELEGDIIDGLKNQDEKDEEDGPGFAVLDFGAKVLFFRTVKEAFAIGKECKYPDEFYTIFKASRFIDGFPPLIKFGSITLEDILYNHKYSPSELVDYFMIPWMLTLEESETFKPTTHLQSIIDNNEIGENQDPLFKTYPVIARRSALYHASVLNTYVSNGLYEPPLTLKLTAIERRAMDESVDTGKCLNKTRDRLKDILLNPDDPQFPELIASFDKYKIYPEAKAQLIKVCNILDDETIEKTYRQCRKLMQAGKHPDLYAFITQMIEKHIIESDKPDLPLPIREIEGFTVDNPPPPKPISKNLWESFRPHLELIDKIAQQLKQKSKTYSVIPNPGKEDFGLFTQPASVQITVNQCNPCNRFDVEFVWERPETEEGMKISISVNCGKQTITWSLLPSPDDPDYEQIKLHLLLIANRTLTGIENDLNTKRKKAPVQGAVRPLEPKPHIPISPPIIPTDPIYKLRREARKQVVNPNDWLNSAVFNKKDKDVTPINILIPPGPELKAYLATLSEIEQETLIREITQINDCIPPDELDEIKNLMVNVFDNISPDERIRFIESMVRYNKGNGNLIRLSHLSIKNKQDLYKLRVGHSRIGLIRWNATDRLIYIPHWIRRRDKAYTH